MTGGIQIEYRTTGGERIGAEQLADTTAEQLKKEILYKGKEIVNDINVYGVVGTTSFIVEVGFSTPDGATTNEIENLKSDFAKKLTTTLGGYSGARVEQSSYVNIGEAFGDYIKKSGYITLTLAIIVISIYIQYAFRGSIPGMPSWPFALVTGVSLLHDVLIAFGLFVITSFFFPQFKVDTFLLTALLTILGYSINDTIVVMDRIRSTLLESTSKKLSFPALIDTAIHDTMRRSIFTSLTIFIVVLSMFLFGPESLKGFALALLYGTLIGTYSSICIASPLLIDLTKKR
jgi:preprotein translocase SecF subunit